MNFKFDEFLFNDFFFYLFFLKLLGGIPGMLTIKMYNLFIYKHNKKYKNNIKTRLKSLKAFQEMRASSQEIRKSSTTFD